MWKPRPQEVQRRPWEVSPHVPQLTAASSERRTRGRHEASGRDDGVVGTSVWRTEAKEDTGRPFSAR
jgi:hypothetical protein